VNDQAQNGGWSATDIDGAFVPLQRQDVAAVMLEGETVVLAEGAAGAFFLDELATLVWDTFDGSASLEELAEDFADAFAAEPGVVLEDILTLTREIGRAGLLEGVAYEEPSEPSFAWPTGVKPGEPIPPFKLPDADGNQVAVSDLQGRQVLLVNWSPRCGFCTLIAPELSALQPELSARGVDLVFITLGDADENRLLLREHGLEPTRLLLGDQGETEVFAGVGTPAAYFVDGEGRAASELTIGADKVPHLARLIAGR